MIRRSIVADAADGDDGVCDRRTLLPARHDRRQCRCQSPQERLRARATLGQHVPLPVAATPSAGPQKTGGGPVHGPRFAMMGEHCELAAALERL